MFVADELLKKQLGSSQPSSSPMQFAGRVAQEAAHDSVTRQSGGTVASNPPRDGNNLIFPVGAGVDQEPMEAQYTLNLCQISIVMFSLGSQWEMTFV